MIRWEVKSQMAFLTLPIEMAVPAIAIQPLLLSGDLTWKQAHPLTISGSKTLHGLMISPLLTTEPYTRHNQVISVPMQVQSPGAYGKLRPTVRYRFFLWANLLMFRTASLSTLTEISLL